MNKDSGGKILKSHNKSEKVKISIDGYEQVMTSQYKADKERIGHDKSELVRKHPVNSAKVGTPSSRLSIALFIDQTARFKIYLKTAKDQKFVVLLLFSLEQSISQFNISQYSIILIVEYVCPLM